MAGLTQKDMAALHLFKQRLLQEFGERVDSAQLFGSKARGEATKHSDIDVLVVLRDATWQDRHQVSALSADVLLETDTVLSTKIFSPEQLSEMKHDRSMFWQSIEPDLQPLA